MGLVFVEIWVSILFRVLISRFVCFWWKVSGGCILRMLLLWLIWLISMLFLCIRLMMCLVCFVLGVLEVWLVMIFSLKNNLVLCIEVMVLWCVISVFSCWWIWVFCVCVFFISFLFLMMLSIVLVIVVEIGLLLNVLK